MRHSPCMKKGTVLLLMLVLGAAAPPPDSPVADAAMRGETEAVRSLLKAGADVNAAQGDGMTALHWAAQHGDVELAQMLVYAGANVHAVTRNGNYTPLHLASKAGNAGVVESLLEAGSDPNAATTIAGTTPLHFAAISGAARAVTVLLEHGAEVDARGSAWKQTPLMWAAAAGRVDVIDVLLARGAKAAATSKVTDIPAREEADRAAEELREERMEALQELAAQAEQSENAGEEGEEAAEGAEKAQAQGANEAAGQGNEPPPAAAAKAGAEREEPPGGTPAQQDSAAARSGEEPSGKQASGEQAKGEAAGEEAEGEEAAGEEEEEEEEEEGPEPLSYGDLVGNKGGLTPLLFAARQGNLEAALALLDAGADVNQVSAGDHTSPLLMAMINGHFDLALRLLERGADPNRASDAGATPLYATLNIQWAPKALYPQPTAYQQQQVTYLDVMKALLEAGADPNVRLTKHLWYMSYNFDLLDVNTRGATPFWRAAYATDVDAMKLLLAHGADPNIPTQKPPERRRRRDRNSGEEEQEKQDPSGLPPVPVGGPAVRPIHAASGVGYGEGYAANAHRHVPGGWLPAVKFLVEELGADVNARDHNGYSALHHAAARGDNEMILYLIEQGADVTAVSREGQTTADMANGPVQRVSPFPKTVELLESLGSVNNHNCQSC